MSEKCIGVFDSGIGGLTVVKSIIDLMPGENIVYFGDTAHVPYGTRSEKQITEYVNEDVRFLMNFDVKAIVVACNTADAIAREKVENNYPVPFFGVVSPASRKAAETTKNGIIGVIATNATIASRSYEKAIGAVDSSLTVIGKACPLLVPLVENNRFRKNDNVIETVLREYLEPLKEQNVDTLLLGCTHYPLLYDVIQDIMPGVSIISSSVAAATELKKGLEAADLLSKSEKGKQEYYVSDNPALFNCTAATFLGNELGCEAKHFSEMQK